MRLVALSERVTTDLQFLASLPSRAHVVEFSRQAVEALGSGMQRAVLRNAAASLSADPEAVSSCIMALSFVFLESAKVRARALLCFAAPHLPAFCSFPPPNNSLA
jgi:hypothetical protein